MAKNTTWANAHRALMAGAVATAFNSGYLRIYSGAQPAGPGTAIGTQVLLAELRFAADAVSAEANGVLTFGAIAPEDAALATGTAAWFRALASDGITAIMDGTCGTADANCILPTLAIVAAVEVAVSSMSVTVAAASAQ